MEYVVLVDEKDREVGTMEKLQAHVEGRLHRAISVFLFNSKGELLLQRRAAGKYHSANLWTNTCCSHPRPGESVFDAANRRLYEEMGIFCISNWVFSFIYKARLDHELTEYELDHVFVGISDKVPIPDIEEVGGWRYVKPIDLVKEIADHPGEFTEWFKICIRDRYKDLFDEIIRTA